MKMLVPFVRQSGFTLIEAVMVITITGILAAIVAVFIRGPLQGYFDTERRADLTDGADTALRQIAREVRTALPNSIRAPSPASDQCFEFLPVVGGGRYRVDTSSSGSGDILDFSTADSSFDVLAAANLPAFSAATYHAVIYNLGIPGADAYAGDNRQQINSTSTSTNIVLTAGFQFPFESPGNRFDVIPDHSVIYSCSGGQLLRSTRAISSGQLGSCPATGTVAVNNISACSFSYTPAVNQRNGQLTMTLVLTQSNESVRLYNEVHVNNAP